MATYVNIYYVKSSSSTLESFYIYSNAATRSC
jgi:hypothetical protein